MFFSQESEVHALFCSSMVLSGSVLRMVGVSSSMEMYYNDRIMWLGGRGRWLLFPGWFWPLLAGLLISSWFTGPTGGSWSSRRLYTPPYLRMVHRIQKGTRYLSSFVIKDADKQPEEQVQRSIWKGPKVGSLFPHGMWGCLSATMWMHSAIWKLSNSHCWRDCTGLHLQFLSPLSWRLVGGVAVLVL